MRRFGWVGSKFAAAAALLSAALGSPAMGGGSPENALVIIDPSDPASLFVGNYYIHARAIPDSNVLYMRPGAADFGQFVAVNAASLQGKLSDSHLEDHIDYIVVAPTADFYVSASGLVSDGCPSTITRFSISAAYTLAQITAKIEGGGLLYSEPNRYYPGTDAARGFDSNLRWYNGVPSSLSQAERYYIGAMLGYTGLRGNTVDELTDMIDRSVASDGAHPAGTFYFMETADAARSDPREGAFPAAVATINAPPPESSAAHLMGNLPSMRHDCQGIMTGLANPDIAGSELTILPGAFCDHLTSYAARFDGSSQVKVSAWIANGASGSWGTVQEPCNYAGKFPHPRVHVYLSQGHSLGEAAFRSIAYLPFQGLLYGDPLTRPYAYLPIVNVADAPTAPVGGTVTLTPTGAATSPAPPPPAPAPIIGRFDLFIDGVLHSSAGNGQTFTVDTRLLADGWHDLRVRAFDNTLLQHANRWIGSLVVSNLGRSSALELVSGGEDGAPLEFTLTTPSPSAVEMRLIQNGRVLAAAPGASAAFTIQQATLGGGPVRLFAEALFSDGRSARSAPLDLNLPQSAPANGAAPVAFNYTKLLSSNQVVALELPATLDAVAGVTYQILTGPTQATFVGSPTGPYRLLRANGDALGRETITFRVTAPGGATADGAVTVVYPPNPGDVNCSGSVDFDDIDLFVRALIGADAYYLEVPDCNYLNADADGNGVVNFDDVDPFVLLLVGA